MVLKWTRTKPEPLKYFEQELNLNPNRYLKRFNTLIKIILAAFLIAPTHWIPRLLFFFILQLIRFFFYKIALITQQVLPAQTGLYRYNEWMVQEINDENLMLTQLNVS